jgi:hypothetical protein
MVARYLWYRHYHSERRIPQNPPDIPRVRALLPFPTECALICHHWDPFV